MVTASGISASDCTGRVCLNENQRQVPRSQPAALMQNRRERGKSSRDWPRFPREIEVAALSKLSFDCLNLRISVNLDGLNL